MKKGKIIEVTTYDGVPKSKHRWGREIEFDLDEIKIRQCAYLYYDNRNKVTRTSEVKGILEGVGCVQIYTKNSIYNILYL